MENRNFNDKELQLAGVISLQSMVGLSSEPQEDKWDTVRYLNPEIDVHNAQRSSPSSSSSSSYSSSSPSSSSPSSFRNVRTFIIMRFVSESKQSTIFFLKGLLFLCGASIIFSFFCRQEVKVLNTRFHVTALKLWGISWSKNKKKTKNKKHSSEVVLKLISFFSDSKFSFRSVSLVWQMSSFFFRRNGAVG